MSVTKDNPAPYAPTSAVLSLIERHRNRGLPSPVDPDVLARAGISDSLVPRTLQALQTLDLIDETGKPTETLEGIRLAPEGEYKQRLVDWLSHAYADALVFVDPATADDTAVRDAFRNYKPVGMQPRMVSLFMGLFTAAGLMPERQRQSHSRKTNGGAARPVVSKKAVTPSRLPRHEPRLPPVPPALHPALAGLLSSLPEAGQGWTKDRREQFVAAFGSVLDFCFPIVPSTEARGDDVDEEGDLE